MGLVTKEEKKIGDIGKMTMDRGSFIKWTQSPNNIKTIMIHHLIWNFCNSLPNGD